MTTPDEAMLWARKNHRNEIAAEAYRAGQSANAERVAVLEAQNARLREALGAIRFDIAQQRGGALYPNDSEGFEMALDDFDNKACAALEDLHDD